VVCRHARTEGRGAREPCRRQRTSEGGDLRSLRPLDVETVVASVAKTNRALCVEEGWPSYGVSAELAARIQKACFEDLDAPVERVGMAEVPLPYAKNLETAALPGEERVQAAVLSTLGLAP
jgi:pyruvate dehydrogenase E1 component beta subunit